MARPTEFDRARALEAAMKLFWRQGYAATSLAQLLDAMEIGRGSLYAAFGDKRSLYVEALDLFAERTRAMVASACERASGVEAVRLFLHDTLVAVPAHRSRLGCMMVNTILELADVDPELNDHAAALLRGVQSLFEQCFREALDAGQDFAGRAPEELAELVMLLNEGLRVSSRKPVPRRQLRRTVDNSLALLAPRAA